MRFSVFSFFLLFFFFPSFFLLPLFFWLSGEYRSSQLPKVKSDSPNFQFPISNFQNRKSISNLHFEYTNKSSQSIKTGYLFRLLVIGNTPPGPVCSTATLSSLFSKNYLHNYFLLDVCTQNKALGSLPRYFGRECIWSCHIIITGPAAACRRVSSGNSSRSSNISNRSFSFTIRFRL